MKFLFLILAIAVSGAASYFTVTQTEKFQAIQKTRIDAYDTNVVVMGNIKKTEGEITVEEGNLDVAQNELAVAQSSVTNFKAENGSIRNQVAGLDAKLVAQEAQLGELQRIFTGVKTELAQIGMEITLGSISDDFKILETSIDNKHKTDEGLDESIKKEEKRLADKRAEIARYNERIQARDLRIAQNEIEARVTAVNHDWGFLVIGAGSNSGFMPDTRLLIKRNGRVIGKVKPSAVELTQTIADIDFKSLSPGVRFQPGDEVILAKPAAN
jgi:hypothetical protein